MTRAEQPEFDAIAKESLNQEFLRVCQLGYGLYLSVEHNYRPRYAKAMCHWATGRAVLAHYILKTRWDHQGWHAT